MGFCQGGVESYDSRGGGRVSLGGNVGGARRPSDQLTTYKEDHARDVLDHIGLDLAVRPRDDFGFCLRIAVAVAVGHAVAVQAGGHAGRVRLDEDGAHEVVGHARLAEGHHRGDERLVASGLAAGDGEVAGGRRRDEGEEANGRLGRLFGAQERGGEHVLSVAWWAPI